MVLGKKKYKQTKTNQKSKHKNPSQSRKLHPGPIAPQFDVLPLDHEDNLKYPFKSSYFSFNVMG